MAQEHHPLIWSAFALASSLLLSGCPAPSQRPTANHQPLTPEPIAALQSPSAAAPSAAPSTAPPRAPKPPRENRLSPATRALVTQAKALLSRGDVDGASSTLDRALRIEPNNPLLWVELGRVRLAENDAHQAEGCGRKALVLASGDRATQNQAGRLLVDALRAQKRNPEAHDIESQPYMN